ncbi:MAG: efflux RND transporter periplasmic adaptor subunit [Gammaproteobacteria bacterium]|nr:efflux RND transporter periplasmic adaptor subunit [Gammaproteobacteria bacterium]MDH5652361.1 efflux RND transporter periplasmic adaptor subunit [Gammaproteobacteria bacterium]
MRLPTQRSPLSLPAMTCLLAVILLGACSDAPDKQAKKAKGKQVEVTNVARTPIQVTRIIAGSLEATHSVEIFNEEQGRITSLPLFEGDRVEKDAVLVELDSSLIQAQLDKANATLRQAELDLKRIRRLMPSQLASEDQLAKANTSLLQSKAEVTLLETRLAHTRIRAPFAGSISARYREPGDVVPIHTHILSLIDPTTLKARFKVSEILLANIQKDTQVDLRIDALGDTRYPARILRVHPVIDPLTRQGVVEVELNPVPAGALPGQLCRLYLTSVTNPLKTIPLAALRHDARGEYVFRVDKDISRQTRVKTGLQLNDRVEILEGLETSDQVIVKGIIGLRDGKPIEIARTIPFDGGLPPPTTPAAHEPKQPAPVPSATAPATPQP